MLQFEVVAIILHLLHLGVQLKIDLDLLAAVDLLLGGVLLIYTILNILSTRILLIGLSMRLLILRAHVRVLVVDQRLEIADLDARSALRICHHGVHLH